MILFTCKLQYTPIINLRNVSVQKSKLEESKIINGIIGGLRFNRDLGWVPIATPIMGGKRGVT